MSTHMSAPKTQRISKRITLKEIATIRSGVNRLSNRALHLAFQVEDFEDAGSSLPINLWQSGMLRLLSDIRKKLGK